MIDFFFGTVQEIDDQRLILDCGFVGISLQTPRAHNFVQGEKIKIYAYMHWNAENGPSLYGFFSTAQRAIFCTVTSCSGIGPKIALAILSDLGVDGFLQAVQAADEQALSSVNGIGKKKAEQMIVALKHKITALLDSGVVLCDTDSSVATIQEVSQALQSLHYSRVEINYAIEYIRKNAKAPEATFDYLLRQALMYLSKQG